MGSQFIKIESIESRQYSNRFPTMQLSGLVQTINTNIRIALPARTCDYYSHKGTITSKLLPINKAYNTKLIKGYEHSSPFIKCGSSRSMAMAYSCTPIETS